MIEAKGRPHGVDLIDIEVNGPQVRARFRNGRTTAAKLIVEDHPATGARHRSQGFQVVVGGARSSVQAKERQLAGRFTVAVDAVPRFVPFERDFAFR